MDNNHNNHPNSTRNPRPGRLRRHPGLSFNGAGIPRYSQHPSLSDLPISGGLEGFIPEPSTSHPLLNKRLVKRLTCWWHQWRREAPNDVGESFPGRGCVQAVFPGAFGEEDLFRSHPRWQPSDWWGQVSLRSELASNALRSVILIMEFWYKRCSRSFL